MKTDQDKSSEARNSSQPVAGEELLPPAAASSGDEKQLEKLREEAGRLTDQLLRTQAEMENQRKRQIREKDEYLQFAAKQTIEALLPILDGFELALANEGGSESYRRGVELIYQQLASTLQRMGLEPIQAKGAIFDPNVHEAIASTESAAHRDQEVIEELQKGYLFKKRLLRPARVRIAKGTSPEETVLNLDVQSE